MKAATMKRVAWLAIPLMAGLARGDELKVTYLPPVTGVTLTVSAPAHTSTPLVVMVRVEGKVQTAAVLGTGLYRMKAIIADGSMHPEIARNPKAQALPSQVDILVPVGGRIAFFVRSHDEVVGGGPNWYTIASCTTPFVFEPREGFAYKATYTKDSKGCSLLTTERAAVPADSPELPLASLEPTP